MVSSMSTAGAARVSGRDVLHHLMTLNIGIVGGCLDCDHVDVTVFIFDP